MNCRVWGIHLYRLVTACQQCGVPRALLRNCLEFDLNQEHGIGLMSLFANLQIYSCSLRLGVAYIRHENKQSHFLTSHINAVRADVACW